MGIPWVLKKFLYLYTHENYLLKIWTTTDITQQYSVGYHGLLLSDKTNKQDNILT